MFCKPAPKLNSSQFLPPIRITTPRHDRAYCNWSTLRVETGFDDDFAGIFVHGLMLIHVFASRSAQKSFINPSRSSIASILSAVLV